MHLHTLTFQAVGPFPGRHTVDLAELGAGGIFLLEGPTGAGKSTLIDMIVFALYGKVASRDASEDRLRSGHAGPDVETFVDLVFETSSGVYRVRRTPAYQRPKQRGAGTTTQQAGVRLWRLASPDAPDTGELLSARLDEAGAELQRIVGLDRDQFVQTIVLPQGEFAGFLRAKPEDRRGLLQKVFGTAVYEQLQVRLERMRAEVHRDVGEALARVRQSTASFCGAAGLDEVATAQLTDLAAESLTTADERPHVERRAAEHVEHLAAASVEADTAAAAARERCATEREALDAARALAAALRRREVLRAEEADLLAQVQEVAALADRAAAARKAGQVLPYVDALTEADRAHAAARDVEAAAQQRAPEDLRATVAAQDEGTSGVEPHLVAARDACTGTVAVLERLVELERGIPARRAALATATGAVQAIDVELHALHGARAERPVRRAELHDQLVVARGTAEGLGAAEQVVVAAEERLAAADDVAARGVEVERAAGGLARLAQAAASSVAHEAALRAARLAGIAGELAAALRPGEPCGVCGGTDHPAPAGLAADHVSAADVAAAEAARATAEGAVASGASRLAALREQVEARRAMTGGLDQAAAKAALLEAQDARDRARAAVRRRKELDTALVRHDQETLSLDQRVADLATRLAAERARVEGLEAALAADVAAVATELDGHATVAERVDEVRDRARRIGAWLAASSAARAAATGVDRCTAELAAALGRAGMASAEEVRACAVTDVVLQGWVRRTEQHARDLDRVRSALAEPPLRDLGEDVVVDVTGAEARHRSADEAATHATALAGQVRDRARAAEDALERLRASVDAAERVRREAVPVVRMANLAAASGSDNAKQLTLATYVLTRRFEDVVAAANGRLTAMSAGRFELARSEEKEAVRARRTGLAMKVVDHEIGGERDPRTLSGGETFYVSLCLALGLADVVTAEAGGTELGTLFVDEGFGTLDPETLEVVLAELGRLRDGGRVVGVVSHVEALKQAIAERVEVRRLPGGGSTLTVRA
ncbi:AAA family ATPase [Actinotalea sp. Marseille-Q4924]|uniref:AAA family ATPase n=1 Tax=Actinotalea sp. Marseille-Q4924 TaxID=2866571 RepID=UPI001CE459E2|nr:AAA family ATPase [Actinotalea sp. Marseille-Q4924]